MKKLIGITGIFAIGMLFSIGANAQMQNVWIGGTPGRPADWDIASNWSLQRTPDVFHDVVMPTTSTSTFSYPVIAGNAEINSLRIESGARLVILETGHLSLLRPGTMEEALANKGTLENRSRNFIEFDSSVYQEGKGSLAAKKQ